MIFVVFLNQLKSIEHIHYVLSIAQRATQRYQQHGINLADSYVIWLTASIQLENIIKSSDVPDDINICKTLHEQMEKRFKFLNTAPLQLATFLDPRVRDLLSDEQARNAICNLGNIWNVIKNINNKINAANTNRQTSTGRPTEKEYLDTYFALRDGEAAKSVSVWEKKAENSRKTRNYNKDVSDIILLLRSYQSWTKEDFNPDEVNYLLKYWKLREDKYPEMYDIAQYVATIPPTQVTVERVFSIVKYVMTDQRTKLSPLILASMIKIRLHREIAEEVMANDINDICGSSPANN